MTNSNLAESQALALFSLLFFNLSMACRLFSAISSDVHFLVCVDAKAKKRTKKKKTMNVMNNLFDIFSIEKKSELNEPFQLPFCFTE